MLEKVKLLTTEYDMLPPGGLVLCALSGGADSMCLLHLLRTLAREVNFRVAAAHFDHRLRGAESDRDAAFVAEWCAGQSIPCVMGAGDVGAEAGQLGQGVEETARQMRYAFLRQTAEAMGAVRIATAHNADDNLETLLLRLCRGTGLHGLAGIPPRRREIVRPLLTCTRAEVLDYLRAQGLPHVEDSSNGDVAYNRNKIRAQVIPVLRELNPRLTQVSAETVRHLRSDNDYLNARAAEACMNARWAEDDLVIEARFIADLPAAIAPRAVRRMLEMMGDGIVNCSGAHLTAVVELARGDDPSAVVSLPGGRMAQRVYKELLFTTQTDPLPPFPLTPLVLDGETVVGDTGWRVRCHPLRSPGARETAPGALYLARARLSGPLMLRPRAQGDEITLPRRGGSKTIKKLFIDERIPRHLRERVPILVDRLGVVAAAGFGPDQSRLASAGEAAYELIFIAPPQG